VPPLNIQIKYIFWCVLYSIDILVVFFIAVIQFTQDINDEEHMAQIQIEKHHKPLIQAAVKLGDWLLSLPNVSDSDAKVIKSVQQALVKLPKVKDGSLAMFGVSIEHGDETSGLVRGWDVSLEYFANDAERQGGLEVFSSYIPIPETDEETVLALKEQSEVYFHFPVGDIAGFIDPKHQKQWIEETINPRQFIQEGDRLRVEVLFNEQYVEIDC
jgi:hypothetical protein